MKYINHMTSSFDDDKHEAARELVGGGVQGLALYGLYWGLAEKIAAQIRQEQIVTWMTKSERKWGQIFDLRPTLIRKRLLLLADLNLIQVWTAGDVICVNMPNILKYCDEYTQKILKKSGVTPETVPSFSGLQAVRHYRHYKDLKPEPVDNSENCGKGIGTDAGDDPGKGVTPAVPTRGRKKKGPEPPAGSASLEELRSSGLLARKQPST